MANITFREGSGLNDSVFGKSQEPIKFFLEKRGEAFEQASMIKEIFSMENSTHYAEKYAAMTAMDGFQAVGESGDYPVDGMQESFSQVLENVTWKDSFTISQEMVEDARLIDMKQKPASFIAGYHRTREKFGAALIGNAIRGVASFGFTGHNFSTKSADGVGVFAKNHPSKVTKKTQSNMFEDNFSKEALAAVECEMQNFRGDNGEVLDVAPTTILIPNRYDLKMKVFEVIGADRDPETANNGFNFLFGRWNVIVWPYLNQFITEDTAPWVLLDKRYNDEKKSAVWQDRLQLTVKSEIAHNDDNIWKGRARFTAGFNDWRAFAVGGVSGGTVLVG